MRSTRPCDEVDRNNRESDAAAPYVLQNKSCRFAPRARAIYKCRNDMQHKILTTMMSATTKLSDISRAKHESPYMMGRPLSCSQHAKFDAAGRTRKQSRPVARASTCGSAGICTAMRSMVASTCMANDLRALRARDLGGDGMARGSPATRAVLSACVSVREALAEDKQVGQSLPGKLRPSGGPRAEGQERQGGELGIPEKSAVAASPGNTALDRSAQLCFTCQPTRSTRRVQHLAILRCGNTPSFDSFSDASDDTAEAITRRLPSVIGIALPFAR